MLKPYSSQHGAVRYIVAVLAAVAALLARKLLNPLLGSENPYHTMWLAVVFTAWYCGVAPSILAVLIGLTGIWYWFLPPYHSFALTSQKEMFGVLGFLIFSAVIVTLGESTRRVIQKREQAEEKLRKAQAELEDRVRERTADLERKSADLAEKAALLDLSNDAVLVKNAHGTISYWNEGAERLYGWKRDEALGRSPHQLLQTVFPIPLDEIQSADQWEGELQHTKRDSSQIVVASRWTTMRDREGNVLGWLEINTDITSRKRAEDAARKLTGRLLTLQDRERRRMARDLHDSLGQYLAALKMNMALLSAADGSQAPLAAECSDIVDKCLTETRTLSHLLHPPLLDEAGLGSAARWYVDGFAQRSGLNVTLELPPEMGRLNGDVETALFRVLQEGLTNVHRHSDSSAVDIRFILGANKVRLQIKDNGHGMPKKTLKRLVEGVADAGVGIPGMRERMRELGGSLEIQSDASGTLLRVEIPIYKSEQVEPEPSQPDSVSL